MSDHRHGPWSSALGDEMSPRLSTFWKRRLALLPTAREAPTSLSRRDLLKLGASGLAAGSLPTFLLARPSVGLPDDGPPGGPGTIYIQAFVKDDPDAKESTLGVFAIDPEAGTWEQLSDLYGSVRVSRDGRTLAISRSGESGPDRREIENSGVWTLDANGEGEPRRVSEFGGVVSWSPDATALIISRGRVEAETDRWRHEVWRINADGAGAARLPIPETEEVDDWSPDGQWLVTVSDRHPPHGSGYQLYVMRPDGTDERRLTEGGGLNVYPRFSPDSQNVAYLHSEKGESSLCVVGIDGLDRRILVPEQDDTGPDHACWSPDGQSLAYTLRTWSRDENGRKYISAAEGSQSRLAILALDGSPPRVLDLPGAFWLGAPDWR